jgi:hypothetical protein
MRRAVASLTAGCAALALALPVAGCGDSGDTATDAVTTTAAGQSPPTTTATGTTPPEPSPQPTPDLAGIAADDTALIEGYLGWTPLPEPPQAELRGLGSAHPGTKRVYASPPRAELVAGGAQRFPYPRGTVVVKEARTDGEITLVAIMEKVRANDAATGGWRYAEYNRASAGEPFAKVNFPESGCAGCHMSANTRQSTDWVFFSLR